MPLWTFLNRLIYLHLPSEVIEEIEPFRYSDKKKKKKSKINIFTKISIRNEKVINLVDKLSKCIHQRNTFTITKTKKKTKKKKRRKNDFSCFCTRFSVGCLSVCLAFITDLFGNLKINSFMWSYTNDFLFLLLSF